MSSPHKIFKATQEPDKLLGGTRKQARKINEQENKAGPAKPTAPPPANQSRDAMSQDNSKEKAPSSYTEGATIYYIPHESQTHNNNDGMSFTSIPNAQVQGILEARGFDLPNSELLDLGGKDGRPSSSPTFSRYSFNYYAKIPSILNDTQIHDHDEWASDTIPNPQTHDGRTSTIIFNPQTYGGRVSSSLTLLRYSANYYARIPSILNGPQTLPSFPWFLNNPNENNEVSLPPVCGGSAPQQIHLHTLEPDHKPEDPELPFRL
ncbi:hypothetical protein RhiirA5_424937 [Rhizophagus irregularis]|uniref:Uncharacterized protein n=1 Tax=Rhizophagus irregularis TaxID=588596 RepID=A0A2I1EZ60_9GLOM|nr:hypothetical protein RhiirA5_424937 [Rhizophagus irregularis]PKC58248.1 hypothetical protein RhiirA1_496091 [Rhizophagus irregularis]PKY27402.1 hypothetical protein RhiirB3_443104 [Rhizophagus irregularis]CAB4488166.1 unnamed protein product [Rhizophagus irregularis]CAB5216197.1 unnamed protein product [Rhizophagus irregularis]